MEEFPKLVNSHDDSVITINNSSFSIGRSLSCDHIIESLGVSRFHCFIKKNGDRWTLFDRSTNGTIVNSTLYKFNQSTELKDGDVIKLGPDNLDFVFTCSHPPKSSESHATPLNEQDFNAIERELEVIDEALLQELEEPFAAEGAPPEAKPQPEPNSEDLDTELTCSICSELFIKAVTLNCSHTFCKFCIDRWMKNKSNCPICRKSITNIAPTLVLDNFIEKFIKTQSDDVKETRKNLIQQREEMVVNMASSSTRSPEVVDVEPGRVIEIYSDDEDYLDVEDEDSDYNYLSDDHDYDVYDCYPDRPRGRYYGGYGRCFICNQAGHWANSCPFKRL
ncbi:E3 ubiquitin-protein ligase CHFR-like Protein [Tribolium castaneum]|uniref:E3 ubiquitin-protein ligase CHFR n=1 Tax=Tribolium castaneum TaxID=7070 RepID=D2A604_TRICA|nr:PREDICTED: E3 ubiquitin-protein ligase RNF8-B [Tribolium castaneum]EFA05001.1 E3 ubiquitin-protein ligase CHFR-like Protein [Tribolium castaneum]|eukprot:XP_008194754.1 PREDICTED: E3 ubiquitin-protein ligase RNF8-B [Tribolium castaneum]